MRGNVDLELPFFKLRSKGARLHVGSLVSIGPPPADTEPDWQQSGKGCSFWSRVKADGTFEIEKAREGRYSLWALNDAQFGEFRRDNVTVKAGETTNPGKLVLQPEVRGKIMWQIGKPDRTAKEFRHGDDCRHWGLWLKYPEEFPRDVDFKIGQSQERTDWNYVQPAVSESRWHMANAGMENPFRYAKGHKPAELGVGMDLNYERRPFIPEESSEPMMARMLGSGANGLGCYMYHGGTNPVLDGWLQADVIFGRRDIRRTQYLPGHRRIAGH